MFSDRIEVSVNYLNQPLILKSHQTFLLIKMPTMDLPTPLKPFYSKKWLVLEASPHGSIVKQRWWERKNISDVLLWSITHLLIFALCYWLLYITWSKSPNSYHANPHLHQYYSSDYLLFHLFLFYMEEKQALFVESSNSDIQKLISIAAPERTRKSTKVAFNRWCKN